MGPWGPPTYQWSLLSRARLINFGMVYPPGKLPQIAKLESLNDFRGVTWTWAVLEFSSSIRNKSITSMMFCRVSSFSFESGNHHLKVSSRELTRSPVMQCHCPMFQEALCGQVVSTWPNLTRIDMCSPSSQFPDNYQEWFRQTKPQKVRSANFWGRSPELVPEPPLLGITIQSPLKAGFRN